MRFYTVFLLVFFINIWSHGVLLRLGNNTEVMMPRWNAISTVIARARTLCNDREPFSGVFIMDIAELQVLIEAM